MGRTESQRCENLMDFLRISLGASSDTGRRERNEDFFGAVTPEDGLLDTRGILVAIADGVSGNEGGREAAEYTVRSLLSDYYATPETWGIPNSLDKLLSAANRWLLAQKGDLSGMASTLSLLVLKGDRYTIAHVGDTRIYLKRGENLTLLTTDHVWESPELRHVLKRAVGLDQHLTIDYSEGELMEKDVFLLVTDGVWEALGQKRMHEILNLHENPQRSAKVLVEQALSSGGQDNATAQVVRIESLGSGMLLEGRDLPLPPRLKVGQSLDGYEVLEIMHDSRETILYKVREESSRKHFVLKTLQSSMKNDEKACSNLLTEEWLGKRIHSHYFPQVVPASSGQRTALYYVMTWHEGATLAAHIESGRHFTVVEARQIGIRLAKGLAVLHRLNIIHRDIKPDNILLGEDGKLNILDLGVALNPALNHEERDANPGTPSYMAPERIGGLEATFGSDLYSAGVTLYHLLTRKYPYGEIEPFQHPRFQDPVPPTRYRPDIPGWLEAIILKAVQRNPSHRYELPEALLLDMELGEQPAFQTISSPKRSRLSPWQIAATLSILLNLFLLYMAGIG